MDILLVLGSVTAKQYEPLRLAMLDRGVKAKIVRIKGPHTSSDYFSQNLKEWEEANGPMNEEKLDDFDEWSDVRTKELLDASIKEAFKDGSIKDVRALLFPLNATVGSDWNWITKSIPSSVPCYQVMRSENDRSQYLLGTGFGASLDIKK